MRHYVSTMAGIIYKHRLWCKMWCIFSLSPRHNQTRNNNNPFGSYSKHTTHVQFGNPTQTTKQQMTNWLIIINHFIKKKAVTNSSNISPYTPNYSTSSTIHKIYHTNLLRINTRLDNSKWCRWVCWRVFLFVDFWEMRGLLPKWKWIKFVVEYMCGGMASSEGRGHWRMWG